MPDDPMLLLSYVNTELRDFYPDFRSFCEDKGVSERELCEKLRGINYEYDKNLNRFV
ncbi:MAG: DUF4250 domain-containing protein [Lachnospiraceae bacterium]|nr:DUF4250 domain-containing protein [Lachnospiraceae bacterium]MCD8097403.1 DUF4250 domain-containing protein [Lachnospiraceae bacterium]